MPQRIPNLYVSLDGHITISYNAWCMVMVSEKTLSEKQLNRLESLLERILQEQSNKGTSAKILQELLTESEYNTILRRLAVMFALDSGSSYYSLRNSLGMSIRTLKRIEKITKQTNSLLIKTLRKLINYKPNNKDRTMAGFKDKSKTQTFTETLDELFGGLPKYGESYSSYRKRQLYRK